MRIILIVSFFLSSGATPAMAHWGHLGEVAGHGHWIAVGAIGAAALLAAALAKPKIEDEEDEEGEPEAGEEAA